MASGPKRLHGPWVGIATAGPVGAGRSESLHCRSVNLRQTSELSQAGPSLTRRAGPTCGGMAGGALSESLESRYLDAELIGRSRTESVFRVLANVIRQRI